MLFKTENMLKLSLRLRLNLPASLTLYVFKKTFKILNSRLFTIDEKAEALHEPS